VTGAAAVTATPQPAVGLRRSLLVSRVEKLDAAFTRAIRLEQWRPWKTLVVGFALAVFCGWLVWAVQDAAYRSRSQSSTYTEDTSGPFGSRSVTMGVASFFGVWLGSVGLVWVVMKGKLFFARMRAYARAADLANEFPAEAAGWGGVAVLEDPVLVRRIRDELNPPAPPPVAPIHEPSSATGEARRRGVAAALARLDAAYTELDGMKKWRFEITLGYGLVLGLLVGWLIGEFTYAANHSVYHFPKLFNSSYGENDWTANLVGFAAGLFVWFVYVWLIRSGVVAVGEDIRKRAERLTEELAGEFPAEVVGWGGRNVLRHPATVRQIRREFEPPAPAAADVDKWAKDLEKIRRELEPPAPAVAPTTSATSGIGPDEVAADPTRKTLLVARLRDLDKALDGFEGAVAGSWVGLVMLWLVGIPAAIAGTAEFFRYDKPKPSDMFILVVVISVASAVAGLSWWTMALIRRNARRKATVKIDRFAADYPRLVEGWGGRGVLESRETLGALIRTYSPESSQEKGGWLGRMFGG
jgi:hypothetical protein